MNTKPIGIFDSGVGGASILKEIHELLPKENIIYLADSAYAPYGNKPKHRILELCIKNTDWLIKKKCKLIVVACNTATTNAISFLRKQYNKVPFIGIEPAIKPAAFKTKTKTIGILATKGTLSSTLFHKTADLYANNITVIEQIGEGIVSLIEAGKVNSEEMKQLLNQYITPMLEQNIDCLVLGCTHYAYLIPRLKSILPKHITVIDSGTAVAKQTQNILKKLNLLNTEINQPVVEIFSNSYSSVIDDILDPKFKTKYIKF